MNETTKTNGTHEFGKNGCYGGDGIGEAVYIRAIDAGHSREIALLISKAFREGFDAGYAQCEQDYAPDHIEA